MTDDDLRYLAKRIAHAKENKEYRFGDSLPILLHEAEELLADARKWRHYMITGDDNMPTNEGEKR